MMLRKWGKWLAVACVSLIAMQPGVPTAKAATNTGYPFSAGTLPSAALNSAFKNAYTCWYGPAARVPRGGSSPALAGMCWWNSAVAGQITLEYSTDTSGAHWVPFATLNTSTFAWTFASGVTVAVGSLTGQVAVANGGTGVGSASGTALDNITGFGFTGLIKRTGPGAYAAAISG